MKQMTTKNKLKILNKLKIVCWSALILAFILKILGVYYIDKGLNVDWLINLNEFVTKHRFIEIGLNYISDTFITFMIVLIVNRKAKLNTKENLIVLSISTLVFVLKLLSSTFGFIGDIFVIIVLPILINKDDKVFAGLRAYYTFILMSVFQVISMLIRLDDLHILNNNIIFNQIMFIDYYIMFVLYYLHSIELNKGGITMGLGSKLWFGGALAQDNGYRKFKQVTSYIGMALTFPVSVPYVLCKRYQLKKKHQENLMK